MVKAKAPFFIVTICQEEYFLVNKKVYVLNKCCGEGTFSARTIEKCTFSASTIGKGTLSASTIGKGTYSVSAVGKVLSQQEL